MRINEYSHVIAQAQPEVLALSDENFGLLSGIDIHKEFSRFDCGLQYSGVLLGYSYLTYLRHHGFPSPLIDWSRSVYVAAFFAYREAAVHKAKRIAIFMLDNASEDGERAPDRSNGGIILRQTGRHVVTHRRHFLQQSDYIVCAQHRDEEWYFYPLEKYLASEAANKYLVRKFTLPADEYPAVLKRFDAFNLNAFSLLRSTEALMEVATNRWLGY